MPTLTITGALNIVGSSGNNIIIRSGDSGVPAYLVLGPSSTCSVGYVTVSDIISTGGLTVYYGPGSLCSLTNVEGWKPSGLYVTGALRLVGNPTTHSEIKSALEDTQARLVVSESATQYVLHTDATDVDSDDGALVIAHGSILTNTENWLSSTREALKQTFYHGAKSNGSINGTFTPGTSRGFIRTERGLALEFDGADSTLITDTTSNVDFINGFTLEAWIKPKTLVETNGCLFNKSEGTSGDSGFSCFYLADKRLSLIINDGTQQYSASNVLLFNDWVHGVVTVSSDGIVTFYIDGSASGTPGSTGELYGITTTNPLTIGNRSGATDRTFKGSIQDAKIINMPLTAAEVLAEYNKTITVYPSRQTKDNFYYPPPTSNTKAVAAYNLDGNVLDISGNSNNGTNYQTQDVPGLRGRAKKGNNINSYVDTNYQFTPDLNDFSFITWVKGTDLEYAMTQAKTTAPYTSQFGVGITNIFWFTTKGLGTLADIQDGDYHQLAMVWDKTTHTYEGFVDGVSIGTSAAVTDYETYTSTFKLFASGDGVFSFCPCTIDSFSAYEYKLTIAEIEEDYNKTMKHVLFIENLSDEGADGLAKVPYGWTLVSGSTTMEEDSTGKYLLADGDSVLKINVDLRGNAGNGYVKTLTNTTGAASTTVDDSTVLSYDYPYLTLSLTDGDKFRKLVITRGA